jgi:putative transposase
VIDVGWVELCCTHHFVDYQLIEKIIMSNYRRFRVEGGCYFFTVALLDRKSALLTENIENLRQVFRDVMKVHPFKIDAAVILPEHLHCILSLPINDDNYSMRWRQIKSAKICIFPSITANRATIIKSARENGEFGNGDFGSMLFEMIPILVTMLIIFITTR